MCRFRRCSVRFAVAIAVATPSPGGAHAGPAPDAPPLRARLVDFTLLGSPYALGGALFTDFGRLWTDFAAHPELDGTGLGLKYGLGGGLRLQQGKTFVIRVDVAWSPDARPLGAYLTAGQAF